MKVNVVVVGWRAKSIGLSAANPGFSILDSVHEAVISNPPCATTTATSRPYHDINEVHLQLFGVKVDCSASRSRLSSQNRRGNLQ